MPDYVQIANDAREAIRDAGKNYTFTRRVETLDPSTGEKTAGAPVTATLAAVILPASKNPLVNTDERYAEALRVGGVRKALMASDAAGSFEPANGDTFVFQGGNWQLEGVTPLAPDGTNLIFNALAYRF